MGLFVRDGDTTYCGVIVCQVNLSQLHQDHALRLTWPHPSYTVRLASGLISCSICIGLRARTCQHCSFFGVLNVACRQLTFPQARDKPYVEEKKIKFSNNFTHVCGLDPRSQCSGDIRRYMPLTAQPQ